MFGNPKNAFAACIQNVTTNWGGQLGIIGCCSKICRGVLLSSCFTLILELAATYHVVFQLIFPSSTFLLPWNPDFPEKRNFQHNCSRLTIVFCWVSQIVSKKKTFLSNVFISLPSLGGSPKASPDLKGVGRAPFWVGGGVGGCLAASLVPLLDNSLTPRRGAGCPGASPTFLPPPTMWC